MTQFGKFGFPFASCCEAVLPWEEVSDMLCFLKERWKQCNSRQFEPMSVCFSLKAIMLMFIIKHACLCFSLFVTLLGLGDYCCPKSLHACLCFFLFLWLRAVQSDLPRGHRIHMLSGSNSHISRYCTVLYWHILCPFRDLSKQPYHYTVSLGLSRLNDQ